MPPKRSAETSARPTAITLPDATRQALRRLTPWPTETTTGLAEDAAERFLRYVRIDTQSDEDSTEYPSTAKQLDLLRLLLDELRALGLDDAAIDEHGYVTATLPATVGTRCRRSRSSRTSTRRAR